MTKTFRITTEQKTIKTREYYIDTSDEFEARKILAKSGYDHEYLNDVRDQDYSEGIIEVKETDIDGNDINQERCDDQVNS